MFLCHYSCVTKIYEKKSIQFRVRMKTHFRTISHAYGTLLCENRFVILGRGTNRVLHTGKTSGSLKKKEICLHVWMRCLYTIASCYNRGDIGNTHFMYVFMLFRIPIKLYRSSYRMYA